VPDRVSGCGNPAQATPVYPFPVDMRAAPGDLDGVRVVALPAEIDLDSAGRVHAALASALAGDITALVADMVATAYCSLEGCRRCCAPAAPPRRPGRSSGWPPYSPPCSVSWT
jgi:hypothetical protein